MADLRVVLPDGQSFVRHPSEPKFPNEPITFEGWARLFAHVLENIINDDGAQTVQAIARRYANRDFAEDALRGWAQWAEVPLTLQWRDQC